MNLQHIKAATAAVFEIKVADLTGPSRQKVFCRPRQLAMFIATQHTDHSLPEIGWHFGRREHTTVMHARDAIKRRMNQELRDDMAKIIRAIPALRERDLGGVFRSTRCQSPTFTTTRQS